MKALLNIVDQWGLRVSVVLILIIFLKTCSTNSKIEKVTEKVEKVKIEIDSLSVKVCEEIKIEGLKSEKRMIQSTDRKILDVTRQTEIDKEISHLEK
jgi:hypothetical protein